MCFYTKNSKIKIATKNIKCYNIVYKKSNYCIYILRENFEYKYNKKYSNKSKLIIFLRWLFNDNITYEAYHSYIIPSHLTNVECIIPKGSLYLIDNCNRLYCSSDIIIKNHL